MRAAAGLHADNPIERQDFPACQKLGVLTGVNVVGDHGQVVLRPKLPAEPLDQRGLAGADRSPHADGKDFSTRPGIRPGAVTRLCMFAVMDGREGAVRPG